MTNPNQPRGPDGRWIRSGSGIAAVVIGAAVALGGGGASGVADLGGAARSVTARGDAPSAKARDRSTVRTVVRLERRGLKVRERGGSADRDCAAHSYGQVRTFFRTHPCTALFRALLEVDDAQGDTVLVAVAWVDMPDEEQAAALKELVDADGTGNVTELTTAVRFTGRWYASARNGTTVVDAQAEPAGRAPTASVLTGLVRHAVG